MQELRINPTIIERAPAVSAYFKSISKFPLLTPEEEADLAERIQHGTRNATMFDVEITCADASQCHLDDGIC